mmetsp:Transcript_33705/g.79488  ORF Transcript_33705/g.79488 Transcript_33705/m.79488 type:complete len:265 (-) Transcript_33705:47-841(-)
MYKETPVQGPLPSERVGPPVDHRGALVQYHLPGIGRQVVGPAVVANDLEDPGFFDVALHHVDNRRGHEWEPVDVWRQYGSLSVGSNPVGRGEHQSLVGPRFQDVLDGSHDGFVVVRREGMGNVLPANVQQGRGCLPVVHVRVALVPELGPHKALVLFPKGLEDPQDLRWRVDLGVSGVCVVLHLSRLLEVHFQAIPFEGVAGQHVLLGFSFSRAGSVWFFLLVQAIGSFFVIDVSLLVAPSHERFVIRIRIVRTGTGGGMLHGP